MSVFLLVACQTADESPEPNGNTDEINETEDNTQNEMDQSEKDNTGDTEENSMGQYDMMSDAELEEQVQGELDGVENVYMMRMGQTVYVAADIQDDSFDVDEKEKAVSQVVKEKLPEVETVRLTTNPDFLDLVNRYREE
jgi:hypothetical protein